MNTYASSSANLPQTLNAVLSEFNGFTELLKRKDNCTHLFDYLKANNITTKDLKMIDELERGRNILYFTLSEFLLSFDDILKNSDDTLKKEMGMFAYSLIENKEKQPEHFLSVFSSVYLCGQIIAQKNPAVKEEGLLADILMNGYYEGFPELQTIKSFIKTFIETW